MSPGSGTEPSRAVQPAGETDHLEVLMRFDAGGTGEMRRADALLHNFLHHRLLCV